MTTPTWFHAGDGLYFERTADAGVRVVKRRAADPDGPIVWQAVLTGQTWAEVVANVSILHDKDLALDAARRLHGGVR